MPHTTTLSEFSFPSAGAGQLRAYRWSPAGRPLAVVQLVHGIAEHVLRYEEFARFLNAHGFLLAAHEHMGHGRSDGKALYFTGGWDAAVRDTYALLERTQADAPGLPYFIFGHSMGSFLTRTMLYTYPRTRLSGVILCGTAWQPKPVLSAGLALCALEKLRVGAENPSKLLTRLMFGAYNANFKPTRTANDWICARQSVVDEYTADPLCGGQATLGLSRELLRGLSRNQQKKNLAAMPKQLPVRLIAGKSDPVGGMGRGVEATARAFRSAGMTAVSMRLFNGRHEILNEENRGEVFADVLQFMQTLL